MPQCLHPNVALLNDQAKAALRVLARRGAFALPLSAKDGGVPVVRRHGTCEKYAGDIAQSIWTKFVSLNLVEPDTGKREWHLTPIGRTTAKGLSSTKHKTRHSAVRSARAKTQGGCNTPQSNLEESPLQWLANRKGRDGQPFVSSEQFAAGERLRNDFTRANLSPKVTMDWSSVRTSSAGRKSCTGVKAVMMSDGVIAARDRVNGALAAVGPELSGVLVDVCCHLKGLEVSEQDAGWPRRSGKVILLLALSSLARHYGLTTPNSGNSASKACVVRHWGQDDYRPAVS